MMEPDSMNSPRNSEKGTNLLELHPPSPGARVRVHSGGLRGLEGTVICLRGNDRLLFKSRLIGGDICVEIDTQVIEYLDGQET
jgi:hypothetical protein